MNCQLLDDFISNFMRCYDCADYTLRCELSLDSKQGFYHELCIFCTSCGWQSSLKTSEEVVDPNHPRSKAKEINLRMTAFIRSLGKGHSALENFSQYVNSPAPMNQKAYRSILLNLHRASKETAEESMKKAAEEIIELKTTAENNDVSRPIVECAVSLDGTWQRRGHASHNGVVTALSVDTGKCLDVETLANACKGCTLWEDKKDKTPEEYNKWKLTHKCRLNHTGSAGSMESIGSVRVFDRSVEKRNLKYSEYLGDGDSSAFKKVIDSKPYGDQTSITKLECVGHVQKRVGSRLRRLKTEYKGTKLEDGKGIGGAGRLTDTKIDTLQNYYGFAIRQNKGNLEGMTAAVKAVLPHVAATADNPSHQMCPNTPDTWCGYRKDPQKYKHTNGLPQAIVDLVSPIFEDLSKKELLSKCLHGKTQNGNECLNKLIWQRCSKEIYVDRITVEEAVYSAVSYFNDGSISILKTLEKLGVKAGYHTETRSNLRDERRLRFAAIKASDKAKQCRKKLRAKRKGFQDKNIAAEGDTYTPGGH